MEFLDKIVISGISGRFPECNNVAEFKVALMNGVDLTSVDDRRYSTEYNMPHKTGKIAEIDKFDASFFCLHSKQAHYTDPRHRILLETVYEAILDAGYNPSELSGSKTGVFVAINSFSNLEEIRRIQVDGYAVMGTGLFNASNRISYFFNFKGPSISLDTACSGSLYALSLATQQLKLGEIENAIVCGTHLVLHPDETQQMNQLNMLSKDGVTRPFSGNRNGIVRGEAVCSILLQKKSHCRREYATVLGCKANANGFNEAGYTLPTVGTQLILLKELYSENHINPNDVVYMELHATGTLAGDKVECETTFRMFGNNRKSPLFIGGVKSNVGHSESTAGLVGIAKIIIAMEEGVIPKTINSEPIDTKIPGIRDGILKVVTTNTELPDGLIGVNSFGLGGTNAHAVLQPNNNMRKTEIQRNHRLVHVSGRTEEAVTYFLDEIEKNKTDEEFLALVDQIHKANIEGHSFRGYTVLGEQPMRQITKCKSSKRPIVLIYPGIGCQWNGMGNDLMVFQSFRDTFNRCATALVPFKVDLWKAIIGESSDNPEAQYHHVCGITAIQLSLTDLLYSLGIKPDLFAGHSIGEVACGYVNGDLTVEQAILAAYGRVHAIVQQPLPDGQMAAIGISKHKLKDMLPEDILIACENGRESVTISGPKKSTRTFVETLQEKDIFVKLVPSNNIAFHSKYILDCHKHLLKYLKNVIPYPKLRSKKWITSSVPSEKMHEEWAKHNCAEYHTNNFKNKVLFDQIFQYIPQNAIVIEVGPHGLLQSVLKRELGPENTLLSLTNRTAEDQVKFLLSSIGKIFMAGGQPNLRKIYNEVSFPVSRGTKMISPLVKWDHSLTWIVPYWKNERHFGAVVKVNLSDDSYSYLNGHNVDGRVLMPAFGYIDLVWQVYASRYLKDKTEFPVVVENAKFLRATHLSENETIEFLINIMRETDYFEIFEGGSVVVTGKIHAPQNLKELKLNESTARKIEDKLMCKRADFYKDAKLRRLMYQGVFQGIVECNFDGTTALVEWMNNFTGFLDSIAQLNLCSDNSKDLCLPSGFKKLVIDPNIFRDECSKKKFIEVTREPFLKQIKTTGMELTGLKLTKAPIRLTAHTDPLLETYNFISYDVPNNYDFDSSLSIALQIISQNVTGLVKNIEILGDSNEDKTTKDINKKILKIAKKLVLTNVEYLLGNFNDTQKKFDCLVLNEPALKKYPSETILDSLNSDKGFIIYFGDLKKKILSQVETIFKTPYLTLLIKINKIVTSFNVINIVNYDFEWLANLKIAAANANQIRTILLSQNEDNSGLLGLIKCLYTENTNSDITSILIDGTETFSLDQKIYRDQLSKNLTINVLNNGKWGTYVHLPMKEVKNKIVNDAAVFTQTLGDFTSFKWIQKTNTTVNHQNKNIVNIHYVALNSIDVELATGKIHTQKVSPEINSELGVEYSGVTSSSKRVMGLVYREALSLKVVTDPFLVWNVPEKWSLAEAATVPALYSMCYYAIIIRGQIEHGESILINAPLLIGIAAVSVASKFSSKIFMSVKTSTEKESIQKLLPFVDVGLTDDTSFMEHVKKKTSDEGLNLILNALNEDFIENSLSLLNTGSRILDFSKNYSPINVELNSIVFGEYSYCFVTMDILLRQKANIKTRLKTLLEEGLSSGQIKPLPSKIFNELETESAFKSLTSEENNHKILIKVPSSVPAVPKIYFDPNKTYIIIGGLGGIGMELTNWMITKGAKKIVLNSRRHIWNGYQTICMRKWSQFKDISVKVDTNSTLTIDGTVELIKEAQKSGPVGGVFNLAMVLRGGMLENQTINNFKDVFKPKLTTTQNIDIVTRQYCPELDYFVVFSSIACGRGNIGQTNYGMANSAMETLCLKRRKENLPGLAIQWGPVAEVGVLAPLDIQKESLYLTPQRIQSCFNALEQFMLEDVTIGSSCVISDKNKALQSTILKTPTTVVAQIMGIDNLDLIDKAGRLVHLGIDSLISAEIKQVLYRNFKIKLNLEDIKSLTFEDLMKMKYQKK